MPTDDQDTARTPMPTPAPFESKRRATRAERVAFAVMPLAVLWQGFVVSRLWGWYLVPLGCHKIGVGHAVFLGITWRIFNLSTETVDKDTVAAATRPLPYVLLAFVVGALALGLGWAVHALVPQ